MKKIYFLLIALIISNASFAGGWVETFNGNIRVVAIDDETVTPPDDAWYFSGITTTNFLGMKSVQTAWKTASSWNFGAGLKPAVASFAYFNGSFVLSGSNSNEFSLVSPQFTPEAGISTIYYEIREIKVMPDVNPQSGEQIYFEIAAKNTEGDWVWTSSSANILAGLTGYNSTTTPVTVLQADLSDFIGQDIKIRFRGVTDRGAFAAVITKVALIDNSALNLAVSTVQNIPVLIPVKHISQVVNATVANQSRATSADEVSINVTSTPAEYEATAAVPALATFQSENITFETPFAPQSFNKYTLKYQLITIPAIPNNSVTSTSFTVTPGTFASDKAYLSGAASNTFPIGKKFTLPVADEIESVSVAWAKSSAEPASYDFKVIIYKVTGGTAVESVFESETLTRPTFAQTPPNGRTATFTDYVFPTPVSLVAGDYIFALKQTDDLHIGVDYTHTSPAYVVDTVSNTTSIDANNNLLIRVNTGSNILLSPSSDHKTADVNAPVLVTFRDANGISGINPAGISIVDGEGTAVTGINATYNAGVITIGHADLEYNTQYTVTIPASAITGYDKAISWSFTTIGTIQPKTYSPGQFAGNVALNAPVSVQFDRNIPAGSSLAGITIVKNDDSQEAVAGVSATVEDYALKIAHADFTNGVEYKVTIPAAAINEYEGEAISWTFTTVPPFGISFFYPENNASDIPLSTIVRVTFNQNIPAGSSLAGITVNGTPVSASISNAQLNINISGLTLQEGTLYEIIIPAGSVAEYNQEIRWSFTTFVPLALVAYSPQENATNVGIGAEIFVQFNKNVLKPMFGTPPPVTIKAGETEVAGISTSTAGNKYIIAHADLEYNTEYTVTVPVNNINNWNEVIAWKFTTESGELEVIGYTPESDAVNVAIRNLVAVNFNKAITLGNTGGVTINGAAPTSVVLGSSIDGINNQLRINHAAFEQGVEYTVVVPAGSVTGYDREITWKFTTVEPLVPVVSPANGAVSVGINEPLTITFNRVPLRPIRPTGSITIEGENGITIDVTNRTWNAEGDVITIGHTPFDNNILYTVTIPSGSIIDAGDYSQTITWSFTTGGTGIKDVTAPAKVYPTITKGKLTINAEPGTKVKVVNLAGQTIAVHQLSGNTLNFSLTCNTGVYLVVLENNKGVSTHKIILQK
jgi:hypothetical protein